MTVHQQQADAATLVGSEARATVESRRSRTAGSQKVQAKGLEPHGQKVVGYRRGYRLAAAKNMIVFQITIAVFESSSGTGNLALKDRNWVFAFAILLGS